MIAELKPPRLAFPGTRAAPGPEGLAACLFGAPHGSPYPGIDSEVHAPSAEAIRAAMAEDAGWAHHWDYDLDGPLLNGRNIRFGDLGDLRTRAADGPGNREKIRALTRRVLEAGAVPVMIGGDDSVPIPFIEAFAGHGPVTLLQIDAHIDWREERRGERFGFSSTMRRASEMPHVERIIQCGMRGLGSARAEEVEAARRWGAQIIPAQRLHAEGIAPVLNLIPAGARVIITFDCDALDGAIMPAVISPTPGGLTYWHMTDLIRAVAQKARIAGMDLIEFVPERDHANQSAAYLAGRILVFTLGMLARSL